MIKHLPILLFITFNLLISICYAQIVSDFCVGDLTLPKGPTGYSCKTKVTADDFVYSGLAVSGNNNNAFKFAVQPAFSAQFPALNGLGLGMLRADIEVGGVVPIHSHHASELIILVEGTIIAGFIDSNNTAYYKTLKKGDMMIFPQGLFHFQSNVGKTPVMLYAGFDSPNPGVQTIPTSLFQNELPSALVSAFTKVDPAQVKKLKNLFGGTN